MQRLLDPFFFYKLLYMFQAVLPPIIRSTKTVHTALGIVKPILLPAIIVDEMELSSSISSTIAAGSSIGLTIPDAVCTVFVLLMMGGRPA